MQIERKGAYSADKELDVYFMNMDRWNLWPA